MQIRNLRAAALAAALLSAPGTVWAQAQTIQGVITSHTEHRIVLRTETGSVNVDLPPGTKIQGTAGAGLLRRETRPASDLIRGLSVSVSGTPSGDGFTAQSVTFKTGDLKTARQIEGGLHETEQNVAANKAAAEANKKAIAEQEERLNNVGNLVAAGRTKAFFDVGKDVLSNQGRLDLQQIAAQAKGIKSGYRLAVVGRADPTGNPEANKRLSERRVAAVKAYLIENCGVLPVFFVPDTALGESSVAQDPDPPKNNAEARRVTVTILISKANAPAG